MGIISKLLSNSPVSMEEMRAKAAEQFRQDNYKDAYETLHELLKMPENTGWLAGKDYVDAVNCLHRLHRNEEMDALRDEALALRPADWEFAAHCAESFRVCPYGMVLEGRFVRDNWSLNVEEQDRHFWMKALLERPVPADGEHLKDYYLALIRLLLEKREIPEEFWRFQILTDVTIEPDYTQEYDIQGGSSTGIPVDENGAPLFFAQPDSWEDAKNDGERLRWLFKRLAEAGGKADSLKLQAKLFWECYGTQEKGRWLGVNELDIKKQLRKLSDDETWTSLATGDRRFLLPSEFNPIHLCRELAELGEAEKLWAYGLLMDIYEARYQFEKAEELCEYIAKHSPDEDCRRRAEDHLREIRGNWCGINGNSKQLAGTPATIDLSFRNAFSASFVAYKIDLERLVKDTWKEIEGGKLEYYSFPELSHNLSTREWTLLTKYLMDGKASGPIKQGIVDEFLRRANCKELSGINPVAVWSVSLTPEEGHLDTIKTLTTPFQEAGAYVVFCQAPQGNTDAMVIVMQELEIIEKKLLGHKLLWQVLDSKTGAPQANMPLDCLLVTERERLLWKNKVCSKALTRQTDKNGFVVLSAEQMLPLIDMKSVGNIKEFEKRLWKIDSTFKEIRLFVRATTLFM